MKPNKGRVEFKCNDLLLERGFYWAKAMALSYVHEGDEVGCWYEASLPGRNAFCMRDVAHYALGAQVLGLAGHNRNMLQKFAQNISAERDFCSYWEITKDNGPLQNDYTCDSDFWYNLPANFDILQVCWKLFQWTNDHDYLHNPGLNAFYNATVKDYIHAWDKNGDGIPERAVPGSRRGIPSYEERDEYANALFMSDLVALQALAFDAYAAIHRMKGNDFLYEEYTKKARSLRAYFDEKWWDGENNRFYAAMLKDGSFNPPSKSDTDMILLPLYYGLITDNSKLNSQLEGIKGWESQFVEYLSYLPEIFYKYNMDEEACKAILRLTDPNLKRREYPEIAYSVVAAFALGIMGIEPRAEKELIRTHARLAGPVRQAEMDNVPLFGGEICVLQDGNRMTQLINRTGSRILWQPVFNCEVAEIFVDGKAVSACHGRKENGQIYSYAEISLENGYRSLAEVRTQGGV